MTDDIYRLKMYELLRPFMLERREAGGRILEISGGELRSEFGFKNAEVWAYPVFDLMKPLAEDAKGKFSFVFANQVIEHVVNPFKAIETIGQLLLPGGYACVTTVFLFPWHGAPYDYFRYSKEGLEAVFDGWSEIHSFGWGNEEGVKAALRWEENNRTVEARQVLEASNDLKFPILTWAWARKP